MQAKLVLLGDMGAGKSSLVLRFVKGQFFEYQFRVSFRSVTVRRILFRLLPTLIRQATLTRLVLGRVSFLQSLPTISLQSYLSARRAPHRRSPPIGAAFLTQTVAVSDAVVKFEIWDTAGQERYHSLAPMYYRGAAAAIIVLRYYQHREPLGLHVSLMLFRSRPSSNFPSSVPKAVPVLSLVLARPAYATLR
ncbi:unnamed protein product [Closterium sp. NIES-65]|nr:unnamed protein product [Closterium sp. NIES-65]